MLSLEVKCRKRTTITEPPVNDEEEPPVDLIMTDNTGKTSDKTPTTEMLNCSKRSAALREFTPPTIPQLLSYQEGLRNQI